MNFSPDGRCFITASLDERLKVFDSATANELLTLSGHAGCVRFVSFSPDGRRLVTANDNQTLVIWDLDMKR